MAFEFARISGLEVPRNAGDEEGGEVGEGREEAGSRQSGDGDESLVFIDSNLKK